MWFIKRFASFISACVCVFIIGSLVWASGLCKLKDISGKRTFYLYSASSQALQVETLTFSQIFSVKGESVRFSLSADSDKRATAEEILSSYGAQILWQETVDGVTSYYAQTPRFSNGVQIQGKKINLHVAVSDTECVVGNPIIFGGF